MNSLNKAQILGNLTRDPELRSTNGGQSICVIGVATNRVWTDTTGIKHDEAEFHTVVCWGKLAEICGQRLKKGNRVFFEGRIKTRNWEDESGQKHYRTEIIADDMIILTSNKPSGEDVNDDSEDNDDHKNSEDNDDHKNSEEEISSNKESEKSGSAGDRDIGM